MDGDVGLRERGKQRRRERILDAALALVREDPSRPLTVERIASQAEVSQATVFNLIGTREQIWQGLAGRALSADTLVVPPRARQPVTRARAIVRQVTERICADGAVFRALLANWSQSGRVLQQDPAAAVLRCLEDAVEDGVVAGSTDLRRLAGIFAAGLNGLAHQWAAGIVDDAGLHQRGSDLVDVTFSAARPTGTAASAAWLGR